MSRVVATLMAIAVLSVAACGGDSERRTSTSSRGEDVDVCTAWALIDSLDEPDAGDSDDLRHWASEIRGVVDDTDPELDEDDDEETQARAQRLLDTIDRELERFEDRVDGDTPAAIAALARSPFTTANDRLASYAESQC